jgi:hypothetical protein
MESVIYSTRNIKLVTPKIIREIKLFALKARQIKLDVMRAPLSEIVERMTECTLLPIVDDNCGGYYSPANKIIAIKEWRIKKDDIAVLNHEVCHYLQSCLGIGINNKTISQEIRHEQQCETMAIILHKEMFPKTIINTRAYSSYFKKEDHVFLMEWHKGFLEDDMELLQQKSQ